MRSTRELAGSDFTIAAQSDAACGSCYESEALLVFFHQPGQRGERVVGGLGDFRAAGGAVRKVLLVGVA